MIFGEQYKSELLQSIDTIDTGRVGVAIEWFKEARANGRHIFVCGNGGGVFTPSPLTSRTPQGAATPDHKRFNILALSGCHPPLPPHSDDVGHALLVTRP